MGTHSSALAWRIPWTEEPDGLRSVGLQSRTRLNDFLFTHMSYRSECDNKVPAIVGF